MNPELFDEYKQRARLLYQEHPEIYNPYFKQGIIFNSDGFHHLQFSARHERTHKEQMFKFSFLSRAIEIIRKSGTIQEYRAGLAPIGKKSVRDGSVPLKYVEYWGMVALIGEKKVKIRVVLRRVGDGNITFWSVMPYSKIKNGRQKIYDEGIEDE